MLVSTRDVMISAFGFSHSEVMTQVIQFKTRLKFMVKGDVQFYTENIVKSSDRQTEKYIVDG
jgi:hypothetical protein